MPILTSKTLELIWYKVQIQALIIAVFITMGAILAIRYPFLFYPEFLHIKGDIKISA